MPGNYTSISPTAYHVAAARARGSVQYAREIARICDAERLTEDFFRMNGHVIDMSRMCSFTHAMVLRLFSVYAALCKTGIPRVVELASGLSPLGLISTESAHRTYLETDLQNMVEKKRDIITQVMRPLRPNLSFASHNVMSSDSWEALISSLTHDDRPVVFVSEGLLMYLAHDERTILYRHIHRALKVLGGVWITPDYVLKKYVVAGATRSARTKEMYSAYVRGTGCDTAMYAYESYDASAFHLAQNSLHAHWCHQCSLAPHVIPSNVLEKSMYFHEQRVAIVHT